MKSKFTQSCVNTYSFLSVSVNLFIPAYIIFVPAGIQVYFQFYTMKFMLFQTLEHSRDH